MSCFLELLLAAILKKGRWGDKPARARLLGAVTQCVDKLLFLLYRRDLYLPNRKQQGNTALDFVIVLYMPVRRQNLIFFNVDFSKRQEMKLINSFMALLTVTASNALPNL